MVKIATNNRQVYISEVPMHLHKDAIKDASTITYIQFALSGLNKRYPRK